VDSLMVELDTTQSTAFNYNPAVHKVTPSEKPVAATLGSDSLKPKP
jgi:hypothetical protein